MPNPPHVRIRVRDPVSGMRIVVTSLTASRLLLLSHSLVVVKKPGHLFHTQAGSLNRNRPPDWSHKKRALYVSNWVKKMASDGDAKALALQPLRNAVKAQGEFYLTNFLTLCQQQFIFNR